LSRLNEVTLRKDKSVYDFPVYWRSTKAKKLFGSKLEETVEDALDRKIEVLDKLLNEPVGYKLILPGDGDPDDHYTNHEQMPLLLNPDLKPLQKSWVTALRILTNSLSN
jgi:hypothetical protein